MLIDKGMNKTELREFVKWLSQKSCKRTTSISQIVFYKDETEVYADEWNAYKRECVLCKSIYCLILTS